MSQREKARAFLKAEGYGGELKEMSVKPGNKGNLVDKMHTGSPHMAAVQTSYDAADMDENGLLRGAVGDI